MKITDRTVKAFFANAELLDYFILRPLSHINISWELTWDLTTQNYEREENTFAGLLIDLIDEISNTKPPRKYHDNEDALANYVIQTLKWPIFKAHNRWEGGDYRSIIEQGGFEDLDEKNLVQAATGRIHAAIKYGQNHFEKMEESHKKMLSAVLTIIIYHRSSSDTEID